MQLTAIDDDVGTAGIVSFSIVEDFPYPFYFAVTSVEGSYVTELYSLETFNREAPFPGSVKVDGKYKYKGNVSIVEVPDTDTLNITIRPTESQ